MDSRNVCNDAEEKELTEPAVCSERGSDTPQDIVDDAAKAVPERWRKAYVDFLSDDLPREILEAGYHKFLLELGRAEAERDQLRVERDAAWQALKKYMDVRDGYGNYSAMDFLLAKPSTEPVDTRKGDSGV